MTQEERELRKLFRRTENDTEDISSIPLSRKEVSRLIRSMRRAIIEETIRGKLPAPLMGVNRSRILGELGVSTIDEGIKEIRKMRKK